MTTEKAWPYSTSVDSAKYDEQLSVLIIAFKNSVYEYYAVPLEVWKAMLTTESPGSFIHQKIKDKFEYQKISE